MNALLSMLEVADVTVVLLYFIILDHIASGGDTIAADVLLLACDSKECIRVISISRFETDATKSGSCPMIVISNPFSFLAEGGEERVDEEVGVAPKAENFSCCCRGEEGEEEDVPEFVVPFVAVAASLETSSRSSIVAPFLPSLPLSPDDENKNFVAKLAKLFVAVEVIIVDVDDEDDGGGNVCRC